jgi:NAD(P)-dependent dehydrogenase (short-subunit alcohol dehydrogenase family)
MRGRTVLITGADKGIGYETARQLGALGYRIWLGSRDADRGVKAAAALKAEGCDVREIVIDVTSDESVRAAAARVQRDDGFLDVLINNAGVLGDMTKAPSEDSIPAIKEVYEVNVFGPIRVTQSFLPLLKAARRANIVMVSSGLGSLGWLSNPANANYGFNLLGYNTSKNALNGVMLVFSKELAQAGIKVNAADPGYTDTDFNGHTGHRTVEQAAKGVVELATLDEDGPTGGYFHDGSPVPW